MGLFDRVRAGVGNAILPPSMRSPRTKPPTHNGNPFALGSGGGHNWGVLSPRPGAMTLRKFSERNVWVRVAINRRKREIAKAEWSIVRRDNPKAKPNDSVVKEATELFTFINDMGFSLSWLLNVIVEDILVMDAGVVEKELTGAGKIAALWTVPGEEIAPDPNWNGSKPKEPRYSQWRDGKKLAAYLNSELIYMMANPRSCSVVGLSPLETLIETVEAELFGSHFEFEQMKQTAPAGLLFLGGGVPPDKVESFREQWEAEIAGSRDIAILGGGGFDADSGTMSQPPQFTPFGRSGREEQRREYMRWLATKVAAAFEMDMLAFNLSEAVHKSVGESIQLKTDQGLLGLASVIEAYITREILWVIDPTHSHAFKFQGLVPTDSMAVAKERAIYMSIGCTTPNMILAEDGKDPVPWGDQPWPTQTQAKAEDPAQMGEEAPADDKGKKPGDDDDDDESEDDK